MNQWFSSLPALAKWTIGVIGSVLIGMGVTSVVTEVASGKACFLSQAQVIHTDQGQKIFQVVTHTKNYGRGSVKDVNVRYVYTVEEGGELGARFADLISENPPDSSSSRCREQKRENWNGRNELTVEFVGCDFEPTEAMDTFTGPYIQKARKIVTTVENESGARWAETMRLSDRDYLRHIRSESTGTRRVQWHNIRISVLVEMGVSTHDLSYEKLREIERQRRACPKFLTPNYC
ncbi:hypothetical protein [Mesorhizobium sp. M6A.T.Ce.TU.016.01.1.1]|uniref:hypothetical protein n=1 Tax=Mesorhizobium sp. M6A.T.Ce.TU.016.01.1.1 TaxID=2496783 RepID=UPI000FCA8852|nr:hypothetical protein [Mesorhizobium sp. M6A.T.Ce.TU.016.01.1.1]RUU29231.1 hypothetical protein EOC94_14275 [Mesorhizobium sp. M6A.T.Ce.TU.016.01.1.1]